MKLCRTCRENKPLSEFYLCKQYGRDTRYPSSECKRCHNKRCYDNQKKRENLPPVYRRKLTDEEKTLKFTYRKNKQRALELLGNKCSFCGYNKCTASLEFHHVYPSRKEKGVSELFRLRLSFERIEKELDKCILLCANCHREYHFNNPLPSTSSEPTLQDTEECGDN